MHLSNKYYLFPVILLLANHETLYNLNIVLSFHPPLSQSMPFLQLQVCDQMVYNFLTANVFFRAKVS